NLSSEMEGAGDLRVLWPLNKALLGLPPTIDKAYKAARNVQRIDNNAFAVLLRRVLELVCLDRGATGDNLQQQLKSLARSNEIPDLLSCSATGSTPTEALQCVEIAKKAWLEKAHADGRHIPKPLYRPS